MDGNVPNGRQPETQLEAAAKPRSPGFERRSGPCLRPDSFKLVSAVALIVLLAFIMVSAETAPAPKYDKSSEVKVKGVIDDVKTAADNTVHVTLKNDKGALECWSRRKNS